MAVYDINGAVISADTSPQKQITVRRNDPSLVNDFLGVAQSYLNHTEIEYKDGDTVFYNDGTSTNGIDCSTYVGLCLMGYSYEESPYNTHRYKHFDEWEENSAHSWSVATMRYKISRFIDGHNPDERLRLACQFARWMSERGQEISMKDGFRDVMPGDIVFWGHRKSSTGEWAHPDWFLHINHIGIVLTRELAPDTYQYTDSSGNVITANWDKLIFPFKHQIIEVTLDTPPCITKKWLEIGQEDTSKIYANNCNTVVMICRPDLGSLPKIENE